MSNKTKIWLALASFLVIAGCAIFGGAMMKFKWDFKKLSTVKYETDDYEISESYKNISVVTDTADIEFLPSESSKSRVVCYEEMSAKHSVSVKDGTLVIEIVDERKWYEHIGINFGTPKITVYIPQGEYGALSVKASTGDAKIPENFKFESIDICQSTGDVTNRASAQESITIKTSTGDIYTQNISARSLNLAVSTGKINVSDVNCEGDVKIAVSTGKTNITGLNCKNLITSGNTGDITLDNAVAAEKFDIKRSTGDVRFNSCDAGEIFVKTDTGSVKGSLISDKVFIVETSTGKVSVPKSTTGGRCEITTDTGNVKITVS